MHTFNYYQAKNIFLKHVKKDSRKDKKRKKGLFEKKKLIHIHLYAHSKFTMVTVTFFHSGEAGSKVADWLEYKRPMLAATCNLKKKIITKKCSFFFYFDVPLNVPLGCVTGEPNAPWQHW